MKYDIPQMEVIELNVKNIIITSFGNGGEGTPGNEGAVTPPDDWS